MYGPALSWLPEFISKSQAIYFFERKRWRYKIIRSILSHLIEVHIGVPQGLVLRQILFVTYINFIELIVNETEVSVSSKYIKFFSSLGLFFNIQKQISFDFITGKTLYRI